MKFTALIFVLLFAGKYGPRLADSNLIIVRNSESQKEKQIAGLVALKQFDETKSADSVSKKFTSIRRRHNA